MVVRQKGLNTRAEIDPFCLLTKIMVVRQKGLNTSLFKAEIDPFGLLTKNNGCETKGSKY